MKRINTKFLVLGVALVLVCIEVAFAQYRASNTLGVQSVAAGVPSAGGLVPEITPQTAAATPIAAGTVVLPSGVTALRPAFLSDSATTIGCGPLTGLPGIRPTIAGTGPTQPAFTVADVMGYNAANHATGLDDLPSTVPPAVVSVEFLTERELKTRILDGVPVPDDTLLCYVQYSGNFSHATPFGPPKYFDRAAEIFDAHTGNLYMETGGNWDK